MASKVNIWNMALLACGAKTITSVDDAVKGVEILGQWYDTIRDDVLREHPWAFAKTRARLAQTTVPVMTYDYAYTMPSDCVLPLTTNQVASYPYHIHGATLECDYDDTDADEDDEYLYLEYVQRVTDESLFPAAFVRALAFALAANVAPSFGLSANAVVVLEQKAAQALADAKYKDAREDRETTTDAWDSTEDTWVSGRSM